MQNWRQPGFAVPFTAPAGGITSGQGCLIGTDLFGLSAGTYAAGIKGELVTEGVVEIAKTSALAIVVGDRLYWDGTNKVVNKTNTAQKPVGVAVRAAANPSATVWMKLTPSTVLAGT
jgi:predicted RecA/RadA family phage recombinase